MKKLTMIGLVMGLAAMLILAGCGKKELTPPPAPTPTELPAAAPVPTPTELPAAAPVPTAQETPVELPPAAPVPPAPGNTETPTGGADLGISTDDLDVGENPDTGIASDVDVSIE